MQLLWLKVLYRKAAELSAQKSRGMRRDITHEGQLWAQRGGDPNVAMTWRADVFSLLVLLQEVCWNLDLFCFALSSSLGTASELGEWVRTAVPWGETLALQFKSFGKGVVFPSCTSSALHFSETSNTWISKSFFSHQPYLSRPFLLFLGPSPFHIMHIIHPIHMPHSSVKPHWRGPRFPSQLVFLHPLFPADIPNLLFSLLLLLCPHHCSSLWLWAAPAILFSINRAETRSAVLQPAIRISPFSSSLRWQILPFVYSHNSASPWTNSSEICFRWDFPGGAGKCLWSCVSMNRCLFVQAHTVL